MTTELTPEEKQALMRRLIVLSAGVRDAASIPQWPAAAQLIELARLHAQLITGVANPMQVWARWLDLPTVGKYKDRLNEETPQLVQMARRVLDAGTVTDLAEIKTGYEWAQWQSAVVHHGHPGRPLAPCAMAVGENAHALEAARVRAGCSGAAWAARFSMSFNTYLKRLEEGAVDAAWVQLGTDLADNSVHLADLKDTAFEPADYTAPTIEELEAALLAEWAVYQATGHPASESTPAPIVDEEGAVDPLATTGSDEVDVG